MLDRNYEVLHLLLLSLGTLLLFSGCAFLRIVVLEDPLTAEEHLSLGLAYEKKGELDSAIKEYTLAAKKLPVAYLYLGNSHLQKEEFDKAERSYRRAIDKNPNNADAYNNLAWLYYLRGADLNEAEGLVLKALELNPSKTDIYRDTLDKIRELNKPMR